MLRRKLRWTGLLIGMISLAGCATQAVVSSCPPLKKYSVEFNQRLADEVLKASPRIVEAISDYYVLRRQVEACQSK